MSAGEHRAPSSIWLAEPQPDHRALIREVLEHEFPEVELHDLSSAPHDSIPELLVVAAAAEFSNSERLRALQRTTPRPRTIWIVEAMGEQPRAVDLRDAVIDKRLGLAFFEQLAAVLRRVARSGPATRSGTDSEQPRRSLETPSRSSSPLPRSAVESNVRPRIPAHWAGLDHELWRALSLELDGAELMASLTARHLERDSAAGRLLGLLHQQLSKAQALARRSAGLRAGLPLLPLPLPIDLWLVLRGEAWGLLPGAVVRQIAPRPFGLWTEVDTALLGRVADTLFDCHRRGGPVAVGIEEAYLDRDYCAAHPGARPGRFLRLSFTSPASSEEQIGGAAKDLAIAFARAHDGYFETDRWGSALLLQQIESLPRIGGPSGAVAVIDTGRADELLLLSLERAGLRALPVQSIDALLSLLRSEERLVALICGSSISSADLNSMLRRVQQLDPLLPVIAQPHNLPRLALPELLEAGLFGLIPEDAALEAITAWMVQLAARR